MGGQGGIRGGKKKGGIKISMHGGEGERGGWAAQHREDK